MAKRKQTTPRHRIAEERTPPGNQPEVWGGKGWICKQCNSCVDPIDAKCYKCGYLREKPVPPIIEGGRKKLSGRTKILAAGFLGTVILLGGVVVVSTKPDYPTPSAHTFEPAPSFSSSPTDSLQPTTGTRRWTSNSDGNSWVSATDEEKHSLARRLAASSRHGNSENYFFDALESFYSEPSVRSEKLDSVCSLVDSGGTLLPKRISKY